MLELGHVNIYMFEGSTNFGFMNGSNYYDELTSDVTSMIMMVCLQSLVISQRNIAAIRGSYPQVCTDSGSNIQHKDREAHTEPYSSTMQSWTL